MAFQDILNQSKVQSDQQYGDYIQPYYKDENGNIDFSRKMGDDGAGGQTYQNVNTEGTTQQTAATMRDAALLKQGVVTLGNERAARDLGSGFQQTAGKSPQESAAYLFGPGQIQQGADGTYYYQTTGGGPLNWDQLAKTNPRTPVSTLPGGIGGDFKGLMGDSALSTPAARVAMLIASFGSSAAGMALQGAAEGGTAAAGTAGLAGSVEGTVGSDLLAEYGSGTVAGTAAGTTAGTAGVGLDTVAGGSAAAAGTSGVTGSGLDTVGSATTGTVEGTAGTDLLNQYGSGTVGGGTAAADATGSVGAATGVTTAGGASTAGLSLKDIQDGYRMVNGVRTLANAATGGNTVPSNSDILNSILGGAGALITAANAPDTTAALNAATNATNLSTAINANQWDYYVNNYRPAETLRIQRATAAGSPEEQARARGAANADVTGAFNTAEKDTARRMQSYGINPGSGAFQSGMGSADLMEGATKAGALTSADRATTARADALLADVTNTGRNIPSNAAAGLNSAATNSTNQALTGAKINAANQAATGYGLNTARPLINAAADWFGSSNNYGNAAATATSTPNFGGANNVVGSTNDYLNQIDGDVIPFESGGRVVVNEVAGRGKGTVTVTDYANEQLAEQPPAQTTLTKSERDARTAKTNQGPTDPAMRRQMGLPPLKFADGGAVIDAEQTGPGRYDATAVKSVLQSRGLNDAVAHTQAHGAAARHRSRAITPHMRRFAGGGGVGAQGGDDAGQDVSAQSAPIAGPGTGTSDSIPAQIDGQQPAALSSGEFVMNSEVPKLTGDEILDAINQAGLRKRQQHGMEPQSPQNSAQVSPDAGMMAYARGGHVYASHGLGR